MRVRQALARYRRDGDIDALRKVLDSVFEHGLSLNGRSRELMLAQDDTVCRSQETSVGEPRRECVVAGVAEELREVRQSVPMTDRNGAGRAAQEFVADRGLSDSRAFAVSIKPDLRMSFDNFELRREIGRGGLGTVYEAHDRCLDRTVAIKLWHRAFPNTDRGRKFLEREAKAIGRLEHPNIVRAYSTGFNGESPYLVMEYVTGPNLFDLVRQNGAFAPLDALELIQDAAKGLLYAHQKGVVHKDVKPSNLLVESNTVKIGDFGMASLLLSESSHLASRGEGADIGIEGTVDFMSPEQSQNGSLDHRTDVYSLGVTFWFLLTGRHPLGNGLLQEKLALLEERGAPALPNSDSAQAVGDIYRKMSAYDREDRYASCAELLEEIERVLSNRLSPVTLLKRHAALGHGLNEQHLTRWLSNFRECDHELCLKLCDNLLSKYFYGHAEFHSAGKEIVEWLKLQQIRPAELVIAPLSGSTSGSQVIPEVVHSAALRGVTFTDFDSVTGDAVSGKYLLLLEDFCSTGHSACQQLRTLSDELEQKVIAKSRGLLIAFVVAFDKGLTRVKEQARHWPRCELFAANILGDGDQVFSPMFDQFSVTERRRLRRICESNRIIAFSSDDRSFHPLGNQNGQSLVVFHYDVPDASLPILWSDRAGWIPLFPRQSSYPALIPTTSCFANRKSEIETLIAGFTNKAKHFWVTGKSGMGKTYLVAHFVTRELPSRLTTEPFNVFWHPFRATTSEQHLIDNLARYLVDHKEVDLADRLRNTPFHPATFADYLIKGMSRDHILVLDRFEDVPEVSRVREAVQLLLANDPQHSPRVIVISDSDTDVSYAIQGTLPTHVRRLELRSFCRSDTNRLVRSIWKEATNSTRGPEKKVLNAVFEIGLHGDPIVTSLATSLSLLIQDAEELNSLANELNETREGRPAVQLRMLWDRLPIDVRLFVAAASCLIPPRYERSIIAMLTALRDRHGCAIRPLSDILEYLDRIGNPFFRATGCSRFETYQMTAFTRRLIHSGLLKGDLELGGVEDAYRTLHRVAGEEFKSLASGSQDEAADQFRDTDNIIHAHYHFLRASDYAACFDLIMDHRGAIYPSDRLDSFLELIDELIEKAGTQLTMSQRLSLTKVKLKLLRRLTRHGDELAVAEEWLEQLPKTEQVERAELLLHRASARSMYCEFDKVVSDCEDAIEIYGTTEGVDTISKYRGITKAMLRKAQSRMSLGQYDVAWEDLCMVLRTYNQFMQGSHGVMEHIPNTILHTTAILCRHACTLYFLLGQYDLARKWISRCQRINERIPDQEGIVVAIQKRARCALIKPNVTTADLSEAIAQTEAGLARLRPTALGNSWWKAVLLEQTATLHLACAQARDVSAQERDFRLREAVRRAAEAKNTVSPLLEVNPGRLLLLRRIETQLLDAKILLEQRQWEGAASAFDDLLATIDCTQLPYSEANVRYEYGSYFARRHQHLKALREYSAAISCLTATGATQALELFLEGMHKNVMDLCRKPPAREKPLLQAFALFSSHLLSTLTTVGELKIKYVGQCRSLIHEILVEHDEDALADLLRRLSAYYAINGMFQEAIDIISRIEQSDAFSTQLRVVTAWSTNAREEISRAILDSEANSRMQVAQRVRDLSRKFESTAEAIWKDPGIEDMHIALGPIENELSKPMARS